MSTGAERSSPIQARAAAPGSSAVRRSRTSGPAGRTTPVSWWTSSPSAVKRTERPSASSTARVTAAVNARSSSGPVNSTYSAVRYTGFAGSIRCADQRPSWASVSGRRSRWVLMRILPAGNLGRISRRGGQVRGQGVPEGTRTGPSARRCDGGCRYGFGPGPGRGSGVRAHRGRPVVRAGVPVRCPLSGPRVGVGQACGLWPWCGARSMTAFGCTTKGRIIIMSSCS